MKIAIVKYNAGNTRSVLCALKRLGYEATVTEDRDELRGADKVIFPGVGQASTAMAYLHSRRLDTFLPSLAQPFLGICLGMQLMCSFSEEHDTRCLGMFPETVRKFTPPNGEKIPHMGWNTLEVEEDPLFAGLSDPLWCYFVHSYYVPLSLDTIASTEYASVKFAASLRKDNFWGCQFHPEKSGSAGERMLKNFLEEI
ncbi:MAG: imidazole glycerol phosphate synthase subunit HisH [Sphaerochaeta sp.]|nr:imidazole glycerol phosphate synthase subunit HisH [Sphaerochaeta sp.]